MTTIPAAKSTCLAPASAEEPEVLLRFLGFAQELAYGEFPGVPAMHNPCAGMHIPAEGEFPADLQDKFQALFRGMGRNDLTVQTVACLCGINLVGWLVIQRDGHWEINVPIERREQVLVLNLDATERKTL